VFLSFHLKVKVVKDLISSGIENNTFGPTNAREHFPEEVCSRVGTKNARSARNLIACENWIF